MTVLTCKCGAKIRLTDDQVEKFSGTKIKCKQCGRVGAVPKHLAYLTEKEIALPEEPLLYDSVVNGCFLWIGSSILSAILAWKIAEPHYSGLLFCIVFIGVWGVLGAIFSHVGVFFLFPLIWFLTGGVSFLKNIFRRMNHTGGDR